MSTEEHSSIIKTPKQLITVLLLAIVFPIAIIVLLAKYSAGGITVHKDGSAMAEEAVAQRLKPVGELAFADSLPQTVASAPEEAQPAAPEAAAPAAAANGAGKAKATYDASCAACHATGAAGAPKLGDKAAWAPRLKTGIDALYTSALKGKNAMPPKGGNAGLSDADVKAVVDYMVDQAK